MKKQLRNYELCKLWALQTEESGRGESLSFKGKDLYITRTKQVIARFVSDKIVFIIINCSSLHQIHISMCCSKDITRFYVISFTDHSENIKEYKEKINGCIIRSKKREREHNLDACESYMENILDYVKEFSIEPDDDILGFQKTIENGGLLNEKEREKLHRKGIEYLKKYELRLAPNNSLCIKKINTKRSFQKLK